MEKPSKIIESNQHCQGNHRTMSLCVHLCETRGNKISLINSHFSITPLALGNGISIQISSQRHLVWQEALSTFLYRISQQQCRTIMFHGGDLMGCCLQVCPPSLTHQFTSWLFFQPLLHPVEEHVENNISFHLYLLVNRP